MRVAASSWEVFFFWKKLFEVLAPRFVELISQQKTTLIELREILVIGWNSVTLTSVLVISILIGYSRRAGYNIPDGNISYKYLFPPNFLLMKNCHFLDVSSDMRIWSHGRPPSWNVCWQLCELKIIYWQINSGPISVRCMIHVLLMIAEPGDRRVRALPNTCLVVVRVLPATLPSLALQHLTMEARTNFF